MHALDCHKGLQFIFSIHMYVRLKRETHARRENVIGMRLIVTTIAQDQFWRCTLVGGGS